MKFAMLIAGDDTLWEGQSAADAEEVVKQVNAWFERWQPSGKIADGGAELEDRTKAKTVRKGANDELVVTDGPYLEIKEVVGGVVMLECDDIDEAVKVASEWPLTRGMSAVEVRPLYVRN